MIEIGSDALRAAINPFGAELSSLSDAQGRELMTDADPAFWKGRAPILFPIVGALNGDILRLGGREYPMPKHGFARHSVFEIAEQGPAHAVLRTVDNSETMARYPFAFLLEIGFAIEGATLTMTARIGNGGDAPMPASFGWHPAFAWPLPYGAPRGDHRIDFADAESGAIKLLDANGLIAADRPSPVRGHGFVLADDLFRDDALIWDPVNSRALRYGPQAGPALRIDFPETPRLGIWTKPGARFICVEPWHGIADPVGFTGDFRDKPGVFEIAPGGSWQCSMWVTLEG